MSFHDHYTDVIISAVSSQITGVSIVCPAVCSGADYQISKLRVTGLCDGNSPVIGEFPAQRARNAENLFILWHRHVIMLLHTHLFAILVFNLRVGITHSYTRLCCRMVLISIVDFSLDVVLKHILCQMLRGYTSVYLREVSKFFHF